jgi:Zn-dependent peptidase ImmA (M78 family)
MPPDRLDVGNPRSYKQKRVEQLANNFAGALLMPESRIRAYWERRPDAEDIHTWLNDTAQRFAVTAQALKFRLIQLNLLSKTDEFEIDDNRLTWNGVRPEARTLPPLFSRPFMERVRWALEQGHVSARKAAKLLGETMTVEDLAELLAQHGMEVPFEL